MKLFENWAKTALITDIVQSGLVLVVHIECADASSIGDVVCELFGRGEEVGKWARAKLSHYTAINILVCVRGEIRVSLLTVRCGWVEHACMYSS